MAGTGLSKSASRRGSKTGLGVSGIKVQIDFVGMCVLYGRSDLSPKYADVCLLDEEQHVHLISFFDSQRYPVVRGLPKGHYRIKGPRGAYPPGDVTVEGGDRLPHVGKKAAYNHGGSKNQGDAYDWMRVVLPLPEGTFSTLPPVLKAAEKNWRFGEDEPEPLTDRSRFSGFFPNSQELSLETKHEDGTPFSIDLPVISGHCQFTIMAIDRNAGRRPRPDFKDGFKLKEFELLYKYCATRRGPLPVFEPPP